MLCLEGEGTIEFFNSTFKLEPTLGFTIRNGLFHRIINKLDNQQLVLLEFENPIDKNDLVRFSDSYGRESLPYEQHSFHTQSGVLISKIFEMVNTGGLLSGNGWEAEILFYPFEINYQIEDTYVVINGYMFDDITSKIVLRPADCIGKRTLARLLERFQASHDLTILNLRPISKE
jgi:hypothetical protein